MRLRKVRGRKIWASVAVAVAVAVAGNDRLVTLTKARPTHKHSQHSHYSPLTGAWFMVGFFAELSLEVGQYSNCSWPTVDNINGKRQ